MSAARSYFSRKIKDTKIKIHRKAITKGEKLDWADDHISLLYSLNEVVIWLETTPQPNWQRKVTERETAKPIRPHFRIVDVKVAISFQNKNFSKIEW